MADKIYVITCNQDLARMGLDRTRMAVSGLEETPISLDWSSSRLVPVIAAERVPYQVGETKVIGIKSISIPPYSVVFQSFYGANGMGHLFCIGALEFKSFVEERIAAVAMFQSRIKSSVLPGDLLGQVIVVPGKKR
jgi:hypothetical protein